jgi:hypothetical protein
MTRRQYLAAAGVAGVASVLMPTVGTCAPSWNFLSVDERNGLPTLSIGGASALSSDFVFWRKNWVWTNTDTKFQITAPYQYSITAINSALNFRLDGRVEKTSSQQLRWKIDLDASRQTPDVVGGGISFKFDLGDFRGQFGDPELLQGNRGWAWGRPNAARLELRFDPPFPPFISSKAANLKYAPCFTAERFHPGRGIIRLPSHFRATLLLPRQLQRNLDLRTRMRGRPTSSNGRDPLSTCHFSMQQKNRQGSVGF